MLTFLGLLTVAVLIILNGYFVAAEFAFVAARRAKLEDEANAGDRRSERALRVLKRLNFMLSGAQLGITITSLLVGFILEPTLGRAIEPILEGAGVPEKAQAGVAIAIGLTIATAAQMVIGELAPKNLAIARPERVARALSASTMFWIEVGGPVIRFFDRAATALLRALGIDPIEESVEGVSVEELDLIVEESAESGKLSPQQAALIERAIDFGSLQASAAMIPWNRVRTTSASSTCEALRQRLRREAHSRFPVLDLDGRVFGVVHTKDLFDVADDSLATTMVSQLTSPPLVVPETATLRTVLGELRREATEMAIVADEYGAPAGVVTLEDLMEELVGDISDEYDPQGPQAEVISEGVWTIPGSWRIDEIERVTEIGLPAQGTYDTVAGLVLSKLQHMAREGDRVEIGEVELLVTGVDGWAVTHVRLSTLKRDDRDEGDGS